MPIFQRCFANLYESAGQGTIFLNFGVFFFGSQVVFDDPSFLIPGCLVMILLNWPNINEGGFEQKELQGNGFFCAEKRGRFDPPGLCIPRQAEQEPHKK